jgi:hypothetical protein
MTNKPVPMAGLDEILAGVHEALEEGATAARIKEIANDNPDARSEIMAFAAEWFASEGSDLSDDVLAVDRTVARHAAILERFWQTCRPQAADPFEGMAADDLKMVASRCRIDTAILRQLARRVIDEATIPGKLIAWLAEATGASLSDVWSYVSSTPAAASADFFAPGGKRSGGKLAFADAVRSSALGQADKQFWLSHLDG